VADKLCRPVVLVVEDEPLLRMNAADMVEEAGFEALEAANAKEAIQLLESRCDICVIFSDIDMPPGMDGMELVALVRQRWPPIAIILVSGHVDPGNVHLPEGAKFFSKPYRPTEVVTALTGMAA
jgi:two-component system, response regulator PdtaR